MTIEQNIVEQLVGIPSAANAALRSMINDRLFPQPPTGLPQAKALPAVTYQRISGVRTYMYGGRAGQITSRFQFNVFGRTELESRTTTDALIAAFDGANFYNQLYGPVDRSDPESRAIFPSIDAVIAHHEAPPT